MNLSESYDTVSARTAAPSTPESVAIRRALASRSPDLAAHYETARILLAGPARLPAWPGLVAHACREITVGLPTAVVGSLVAQGRARPSDDLLGQLHQAFELAKDAQPDLSDPNWANAGASRQWMFASSFADVLEQTMAEYQRGGIFFRGRITQMMRTIGPTAAAAAENSPEVKAYHAIHEWFEGQRHERRDGEPRAADISEFRGWFGLLERLLLGLLGDYVTTRASLDSMLVEANKLPWMLPTADVVETVSDLTIRPQEADYFYGRLQNPLWVDALLVRGMFQDAPGPVREGDDVQFLRWAPSEFVSRVSGVHPEPDVIARAIVSLSQTENLRVLAEALKACQEIRPDMTTNLVKRIRQCISSNSGSALSIALDEIAAWSRHQSQTVEGARAAVGVLHNLLRPMSMENGLAEQRAMLRVDTWHLRRFVDEVLPTLARILPVETCGVLARVSGNAAAIEASGTRSERDRRWEDYSEIWFPTVDSSSERDDHNDRAFLASVLTAAGSIASAAHPEMIGPIVEAIERPGWLVHHRIAVSILTASLGRDNHAGV